MKPIFKVTYMQEKSKTMLNPAVFWEGEYELFIQPFHFSFAVRFELCQYSLHRACAVIFKELFMV